MFVKKIFSIKTLVFAIFLVVLCNLTPRAQGKSTTENYKNTKFKAREKLYKDLIQQNQLSDISLLAAYDSLMMLCAQQNKMEEVCLWAMEKSAELRKIGKYSASFFESKHCLHLMDSLHLNQSPQLVNKNVECLYDMAKMALNLGLYDQSVGYLFDMISISKNTNQSIQAYSLLSLLFINMDKPQLAANYINKATKLINSSKTKVDSATMFIYYNHYGGVFYAQKKYNEAIAQMEKAEEYAQKENEEDLLVVYYNLSNIYISLDERVLARNYLLNILKICKDKTSYLHALATQNVGYIYFLEGQYQQALTYYTQAMALAHKIDAKKLLSSTLIEMSEVYMELQDYKTAWTYQKQGYTLKDSVMNTKAMEEIMIQTNNFEQRQEKLEKQILTQNLLVNTLQNRNKTVLLIILFVLLAIFIVLLAWILKRLKVQQNNNKNLNNTLSTLEDNTKKEVLHSTQKLNEDIDFKNRELTSTSLLLIKANEMVGILKNEIKKLKVCKMEEATKEIVNEMESVLNTHNTDQNWQEFKLYFEQVHPNFFFSLTHLCPELSTSEQRTCALIFLNFSTKEIASITHRSPRTVETIMYQIRKKLNIPSEEKTLNFIQDILRKENIK